MSLYSLKLVDEINSFAKEKHAEIVYNKCLKAGKTELAKKILRKYKLYNIHRGDDMVFAFEFALRAIPKV